MIEAQQHIRAIAYGVAAGGILLAIVWPACGSQRVSRVPSSSWRARPKKSPSGNWETRVPERKHGRDEVSVLARSFNHMTGQLVSQRERLVQSERVAAWRELSAAACARTQESRCSRCN
jgi:two-component system, NtrC family, nitrogen regulation sensor histidine kinase NtrY